MLRQLGLQLDALPDGAVPRDFQAVARKLYPSMPHDAGDFVTTCNEIMALDTWPAFWIVTAWIKRRGDLHRHRHFPDYEKWLHEYTDNWGKCDLLCGRVLNPTLGENPGLYDHLLKWTESPGIYVRRAAAVALIESGRSFSVNVEFDRVKGICERLKYDEEYYVQKGVGWLLKYSYLAHPDETISYLEENVGELSRIAFRYALVKTPPGLRRQMMSLPWR